MIYAVRFKEPWRGDRRRYYALRYVVPRDLTDGEAQRAIRQGVAVAVKPLQTSTVAPARKGPAPENKLRPPAPENKVLPVVEPRDMRRNVARLRHRQAAKPAPWPVPAEWAGETAVCLGGGPSLTREQVDYVRGKARVIAINDAYRLAPWAEVLYACDYKWWTWHPEAPRFAGRKVTHSEVAAREWPALHWLPGDKHAPGLSRDPAKLHCGRNSGYQAINLASLFGARRIVLLGYDMRRGADGRGHWFGEHPTRVKSTYTSWLAAFATIVPQLSALGLEIINCTPGSALRCFPQRKLDEVL